MSPVVRKIGILGAVLMAVLIARPMMAEGPIRPQAGIRRTVSAAEMGHATTTPQRATPLLLPKPKPENGKWGGVADTGLGVVYFSLGYLLFFLPSMIGRNKERAVVIVVLNILVYLWPVAMWMAVVGRPARSRG
jgi:hypothetical protein